MLHWCTESKDYDPTAMLLAVTFSSPQTDLWSDQDFATWLLTLRAGSFLLGVGACLPRHPGYRRLSVPRMQDWNSFLRL